MRTAVQERRRGILTYGITPPKQSYSEERKREVASIQTARIKQLPVDGLVVYDIQDESGRTEQERPFPYLRCIDPVDYAFQYLKNLSTPKVVYRCVAPLDEQSLTLSLQTISENNGLSVLVGAASRSQQKTLRLSEAYEIRREHAAELPLGGVLIAERHSSHQGEDERILSKVKKGCTFFITQAVYSVTTSKNALSDLSYRCQKNEQPIPPIMVTLSPCGSEKTLEFMNWLGISVPRWLRNELVHSPDILKTSVDICMRVLEDLLEFADLRGIPLGCNIESVSLRKSEIDASVELVHRAARLLGK